MYSRLMSSRTLCGYFQIGRRSPGSRSRDARSIFEIFRGGASLRVTETLGLIVGVTLGVVVVLGLVVGVTL